MAYERARHVLRVKTVGWSVLWFLLCLLYAAWLALLVYADQAGWEPQGRWAALPTATWSYLGMALYVVVAVYFLALLTRREVPARVYVFGATSESPTPSFLAEPPAAPAPESKPPTQG